ncbi:vWA domain-containing protein [Streptomyces ipomoeae]|uniref:vWA domain-containing protein n=1 Tax=Streptomyces ipomoeae TaxID=103232 RepID=UPI001146D635|nr:vWA domain-containing protein [Streptomyces ipomoeae]MDX2935568.1 VWA domain-containing protein [Streptomyces ipomoeae]TQE18386.1 VWA domain-containing protein [Streptomyces ipomoeae]
MSVQGIGRVRSALMLTTLGGALVGSLIGAPTHSAQTALMRPGVTMASVSDPVDIAILVDASASIRPHDFTRQVRAAAVLGQGEISNDSTVTVIAFADSQKRDEKPVNQLCPVTALTVAGREELSTCLDSRAYWGTRIGKGTDFPSALDFAMGRLREQGSDQARDLIFLMTDGRMDVSAAPAYGADPATRMAQGEKRLRSTLARARQDHVQIWPIGMGSGANRQELRSLADGGFTTPCSTGPASSSRAQVVQSADHLMDSLTTAFAASRCDRHTSGTSANSRNELTVTVPVHAGRVSLILAKQDPRVTATYFDPAGHHVPTTGDFGGSGFEASGGNGPVESLRISNPLPGVWTVLLTAPEGLSLEETDLRAVWRPELRPSLSISPASPRPGERVTAVMRLLSPRGVPVTDPESIPGVAARLEITPRQEEPAEETMRDDGLGPDVKARDMLFTAQVVVPANATGEVSFVSRVSAHGAEVTGNGALATTISTAQRPLTARVSALEEASYPGGRVSGSLLVANGDAHPHTLKLSVVEAAQAVSVEPNTVTVKPGAALNIDITLVLGESVQLGSVGGLLRVADASQDGRLVDASFLSVTVTPGPTWWERQRGVTLCATAVLLAATVALASVRSRQGSRLDRVVLTLASSTWYGVIVQTSAAVPPHRPVDPPNRS